MHQDTPTTNTPPPPRLVPEDEKRPLQNYLVRE